MARRGGDSPQWEPVESGTSTVETVSLTAGTAKKTMVPVYLATAKGSSNYKVDVSFSTGMIDGSIRQIFKKEFRAVLDTGAAPVIIRRAALPDGAEIHELTDPPLLVDAQRSALRIAGVVKSVIQMGRGKYHVTALVADELSVDLILGTQFIDSHVQIINARRRSVIMDLGDEVPLADAQYRLAERVFVTERVLVPPKSEVVVPVRCNSRGLCLVTCVGRKRTAVANGLHELEEGAPFAIMVANFGDSAVTLVPGSVIARAEPNPENSMLNVEEDPPGAVAKDWREDLDLEGLTDEQKNTVICLLEKHSRLWDENRLGVLHGTQHRIETTGNPVFQHPYRAGPAARQAEKIEVDRMLKQGVIEPSHAQWASPVVLIPKPDGSIRFCIDYRRLNALTVRDVYPLPRMDECLDSLGDAEYFSTLDANTGFWQIEVAEEDRDKTTFSCHVGMYRFLRMPFGLVNAPATFQRAMDIILSEVRWDSVLVYLDDVIIFSRSFEEHVKHLGIVLQKMSEAGATLKFPKCKFFRQAVDYLGHRILPHKLQVLKRNVDAISRAEPPTTKTQVRSFLGLCGVYRRFVPNYASLAKPLTALTKKGAPESFELGPCERVSFETLRDRLISPPTLALPREGRPYVIETDASDGQIGCVLQQSDDEGEPHPLGYWSRQLNSAEVNYSATEKEALAIVWAVTHLRPYLERSHFTVRTDHSSLQWLLSISGDNARLVRWRLRLAEFSFSIEYRPGRVNQVADALSRLPTRGTDKSDLDLELPCLSIGNPRAVVQSISVPRGGPTVEEIPLEPLAVSEVISAQAEDELCKVLLQRGKIAEDYRGMLCRTSPLDGAVQILVPEKLREKCMGLFHLPRIAGHSGSSKMYEQMRRYLYWPRMSIDVANYVSNCPSCIKRSLRNSRKTTRLLLFPPSAPMEFVAMDILGPLTTTTRGNRFLLVITDRFTKLTRAYPLANTTAEVVAKMFFDGWVASGYGIPQVLLTDNGSQFVAKFFQTFCKILGLKQVFTSAYRPSTNGQTERFNRTVAEFMGAYVSEHQSDWDDLAAVATYSYNNKPHASTGFTPFELVTAIPQQSLLPQVLISPERSTRTKAQLRNDFLAKVSVSCELARENLATRQQRYKDAYDSHVKQVTNDLSEGDLAFVKTFVAPKELSKKLVFPAVGPFVVTKVGIDRRTFQVRTTEGYVTVAADRIRKCPAPKDLPDGMMFAQPVPEGVSHDSVMNDFEDTPDDLHEYVVDRIVSHRKDEGGIMRLRIRWFGYGPSADTWEPLIHLPVEMVRRYVKRKRLKSNDFVLGPSPAES
jgi:transposase InsO family protein